MRGGHGLGSVDDDEITPVGAFEGPSGGPVGEAQISQHPTIFVLGAHRRHGGDQGFDLAVNADFAPGEGAGGAGLVDVLLQGLHGGKPGGGDGDGGFGHVGLEASQPYGIGAGFLEQEVALAHDFFKDGDAEMFGIEGGHQAVEEAPSVARRPGKEPVHGGGEPEHAHVFGQGARALLQVAIDEHEAAGCGAIGFAGGHAPAGSEFHFMVGGSDLGGDGPGGGIPQIGQFIEAGAAQAAAGGEQRDGFQQVGLARAIGAGEGHKARRYVQPQAGIIAEIGERQAGEGEAG